jgi:hypothetical protein
MFFEFFKNNLSLA